MRYAALSILLLLTHAPELSAQTNGGAKPTNLEVFQTLVLECLDFIEEAGNPAYLIDAPTRMPFLRGSVAATLKKAGADVYLADSTYTNQPAELATLKYRIDDARVDYARRKKKQASRSVRFSATSSLVSFNGQLLADKACNKTFKDIVHVADIPGLENKAYPETQASPVKAGFGRRVLQPVMLAAGTALTVFLFFTLRSDSDEG